MEEFVLYLAGLCLFVCFCFHGANDRASEHNNKIAHKIRDVCIAYFEHYSNHKLVLLD